MKIQMQKLVICIVLMMGVVPFSHADERKDGLLSGTIEKLLRRGDDDSENGGEFKKLPESRIEMQLSFAPLVKETAPAVVNVFAKRTATTQRSRSPFAGDPFFEQFFGRNFGRRQQKRQQSSLGSGVIVREDGIVITNHHVIKGADQVKIALSDGREFEAKIVLKDEQSDLAVLQVVDDVSFPTLQLANSDEVEVGDLALAIGNPFGVGQTVTSGIVSAVARSRGGINDFGFFLQTDAAINPGNSGGALVDMQGRLIGINTAIFTKSGGSNGIGFAVPSNMVNVILQSAEMGSSSLLRPWVGATFQAITSDIAESLGLERPRGALIASVVPEGPAGRAGLRAGDVILAVNGNQLSSLESLGYRLTTIGVGKQAEFDVLSAGKQKRVSLELKVAPETIPRDERRMPDDSGLAGATVANLSPALAQEIRVSLEKSGVIVLTVDRRSPAFQNRIRPGDIIRAVNGKQVATTKQLEGIVAGTLQEMEIVVERKNRQLTFVRSGRFFRQYTR